MRAMASGAVWLAACGRIGFGVHGGATDAPRPTPDVASRLPDAPLADGALPDAASLGPVVQAVGFDTASGAFTVDSTHGGLAPVTAGDMVLVVCGAPSTTGTCSPTSTPAATWQQIDSGTTLSVYVTCGAPAISAIHLENGAGNMMAAVVEFSGVKTSGCYDTGRFGKQCTAAPSTWTVTSPTVAQARELMVPLGEAGIANAGWTVSSPYTKAIDATGVNGAEDVFVAYQLVNAAPMPYTATGTIAGWNMTCFNDLFAFELP